MVMTDDTIHDISDTALWIAGYRAKETALPNPVFNDFLAARLAGDRGMQMAEDMPQAEAMFFAMVVRTSGIDRLVTEAIAKGVDTVINLGAGLDTRPYRMSLPAELNWIEVDFPKIIDYKTRLITEKTVCRLQRYAVDLSNDAEREKLFTQLGQETKKALIITEGVIGYLTPEQASILSRSIYAIPSFQYWIMDFSQGKMRNQYRKEIKEKLKHTPLKFKADNQIAFFCNDGWKVSSNIYILDEADRIGKRLPAMKFPVNIALRLFPKKMRELGNKTYGYVMFGKE